MSLQLLGTVDRVGAAVAEHQVPHRVLEVPVLQLVQAAHLVAQRSRLRLRLLALSTRTDSKCPPLREAPGTPGIRTVRYTPWRCMVPLRG